MSQTKATRANPFCTFLIYVVILLVTVSCLLPILNLLALSFSDSQAIIENKVTILPVEFTLKAYEFVMGSEEFWQSCLVSLKRVILGVPLNIILTILVAYPLSKDEHAFPQRKRYAIWKGLAACGVETDDLLANHINYPVKEMHWLFAAELLKTMLRL